MGAENTEKEQTNITEEKGDDQNSLDQDDVTGVLKLTSKDNQEHMVDKKNALVSVLVKTCIENSPTETEVPLPGVDGAILKEVIRYMDHHKGTELPPVESPLKSIKMKEVCSDPWDAEFIDELGDIRQDLYDLILAANYMDIKSLLHLGLAKVASLIKGKPLDKLKEILTTDNDAKKRAEREKKQKAESKNDGNEETKKAETTESKDKDT